LKFFAVLLFLWIAGCATYGAVGLDERRQEIFAGEVNANLLAGGSNFKLIGRTSGILCSGVTNVTQLAITCQGQKGDVFATCNDGTTLKGEWYAQSCTTGIGQIVDSLGGQFAFKFGLSDSEMKIEIKQYEERIRANRNESKQLKGNDPI
jgi:hypothetical protein